MCFSSFLQRKRSAVSKVKQEAQEVLEQGEHLLAEANQLSDNINKEVEVHRHWLFNFCCLLQPAFYLLVSLGFFFAFMPSK